MVRQLVDNSIAPSTKRSYECGQKRYHQFCTTHKFLSYPLSENVACLYVAFLAEQNLSHGTIKSYLSAIRRGQIVRGLGDPFVASWPLLESTLKGVKRQQAKKSPTQSQPRLPVTPQILGHLRDIWDRDKHNPDHIMLWAACCMCFFGFLRSGEITVPSLSTYDPGAHLSAGDVRVDKATDPDMVRVHIKASKTDPFRKGVFVYLGRTDKKLCPVAAISAYMALRGLEEGPFFLFSSGCTLSRERLVRHMRQALEEAGLSNRGFSGHSFRIGAATTAAAGGIEDCLIKTLGRWESSAYQRYVKLPRASLAAISKQLC